jgi:hypothetical protein
MPSANPIEKSQCAAVTRQKQMIAIVDRDAQGRLEIGSAAPAGMPRQLVHDNGTPAICELNCGRQPGETRPDNVGRATEH